MKAFRTHDKMTSGCVIPRTRGCREGEGIPGEEECSTKWHENRAGRQVIKDNLFFFPKMCVPTSIPHSSQTRIPQQSPELILGTIIL